MSKFDVFTIDLRVILWIIVATGVYALLLKFLQKNSPHNVQTKGGGVKGLLNNVQKNCTFLTRWLPLARKLLECQTPELAEKLRTGWRGHEQRAPQLT